MQLAARPLPLLILLATIITICGCGSPSATPEQVFEKANTALIAEDYVTYCGQLTPETVNTQTVQLLMSGISIKRIAALAATQSDSENDLSAKLKQLDDVLAKHDVTAEKLEELQGMGRGMKREEVLKKVSGLVANKPQFIGDMLAAISNLMNEDRGKSTFQSALSGKLNNLKIEGDRATAQVETADDKQMPIEFHRGNGGWKIHMPLMESAPSGNSQPADGNQA